MILDRPQLHLRDSISTPSVGLHGLSIIAADHLRHIPKLQLTTKLFTDMWQPSTLHS